MRDSSEVSWQASWLRGIEQGLLFRWARRERCRGGVCANAAPKHKPPEGPEPSGGSISARADHLPTIWPRPSLGPAVIVVLDRHSAWPPRRVASHDPKTAKERQYAIKVKERQALSALNMLDPAAPARP
jgi:hypothetical protein